MSHITKSRIVRYDGQDWFINHRYGGVYLGAMTSIMRQLHCILDYHSKILVIRFDLRLYVYTADNEVISRFNELLHRWLRRNYGMKRLGFCWAREMENSDKQHYHYALMLNGHKVRHPSKILEQAKLYWDEYIQGSFFVPENCYYFIQRHDKEAMQNVIFRLSYLAKVNGKENRPDQTKRFGSSRLENTGSQRLSNRVSSKMVESSPHV